MVTGSKTEICKFLASQGFSKAEARTYIKKADKEDQLERTTCKKCADLREASTHGCFMRVSKPACQWGEP